MQPYAAGSDIGGDSETDRPLIGPETVAALTSVRAYAPNAYPAIYTGVSARTGRDPAVLRIHLTELDPAVESDLLAVSGLKRGQVRFEQSFVSARDARAAEDRVAADVASGAFGAAVDDLAGWDTGSDGLLELSVRGHDEAQLERLIERYGPAVRVITDVPGPTGS